MNTPLVTIAIPVYNAEDFLQFAILSVLNQSYTNWELILMEDGSTDQSLSICEDFASKDCRIRLVKDNKNRGLIYRLNESISLAQGKYYARMDADDIMFVNRIEEQVKIFEDYPEIDVCGTSIMTIDRSNNIIGSDFCEGFVDSFIHPTVMGKTEWFKSNPYADWALRAEDFELWTRTSSFSNFYAISKPLFFYREFGVSTFKKNFLSLKTIIKIVRKYKKYNKSFYWYLRVASITYGKILLNAFFAFIGRMDVLVGLRRRIPVPDSIKLTIDDLYRSINRNNLF